MIESEPLFWGGPFEIIGWIVAGLLLVLVLGFIFVIVTRKKITILDELAAIMNQQQDESHIIEGSLDRENEEERKR